MNIFSRFDHLTDLTENEKILVKYIKENPDKFISMSSSQISKTCYVSSSSLYRLCHKLGYAGLSELKVQVSASLTHYIQEQKDFDYDYPIKPHQTQYQITHKLKEVYDQTIITALNLIDLEQLRLSVNLMKKAKVIDVYTSAGNVYFAQNFQFQMREIGVNINVPVEEYTQNLMAASSDESHVAIVISVGGRGGVVNNILKILKKNKTPIIIVTAPNSQVEHYGKYVLYMNPYENHYNKISSFSTRLSLLYILDTLYTCYFETDYDGNIKKKIQYYKTMTEPRGGIK